MSETQIIKKIVPAIKVSSMDNHRMLTHPAAAPARAGTQAPRRTGGGGQPIKHQQNDVAFRQAPMEAVMGGGGVIVKHPHPHPRAAAAPPMTLSTPAPALARGVAPALTPEHVTFLVQLVDAHMTKRSELGALSGAQGAVELDLARGVMAALAQIAPDAVIKAVRGTAAALDKQTPAQVSPAGVTSADLLEIR